MEAVEMKVKPYKGKYTSRKRANEINDMFALSKKPDRTELEIEAKEFINIIRQRRTSNIKVKV